MTNIPAELRALPLEHIIGSPLVAAITAQSVAAQATVDFIKEVGLKPRDLEAGEVAGDFDSFAEADAGQEKAFEARYVDFKFDRVLEEEKIENNVKTTKYVLQPSKLTVPLLSIVPIPYIRINDMTIDFEFQIKDVVTKEKTTESKISTSAKARWWFVQASMKGSFCNRTANKRQTDRRTTLKITVNAVQDEMPEGLGRVLDILHEATKVVPLGGPTTLTEVSEVVPP